MVIFNGGSKSPITRKKNIGPPTIYYKNCHNRGLAHVPCMTRTPTRYPHRFIWVWCVGLDLRSAPNKWGHPKPTPGYVCGPCVGRSQLASPDPHNYKVYKKVTFSNTKNVHSAEPGILGGYRKCLNLPSAMGSAKPGMSNRCTREPR